jgi:alpha-beta hydrolase superfamily lysophospholipase
MWLRDDLPKNLPGIRACIYGYDTSLAKSSSLQTIPHLSRFLIQQLEAYGWKQQAAKPVVFLAHSLGGVVLKEAMLALANSSDAQHQVILEKVKGAIFFGVPSLGMEQAHLMAIVKGQTNEQLVQDLSRYSSFLRDQEKGFSGASFTRRMKLFWAFETAESPTVLVCWPENCRSSKYGD